MFEEWDVGYFRRVQSPKVTEVSVLRDDATMQGGRLLQAIQVKEKAKINSCLPNPMNCLIWCPILCSIAI